MQDIKFNSRSVTVTANFLATPIELPLVIVDNAPADDKYVHVTSKNGQVPRLLVADRFLPYFPSRLKALRSTNILRTLKDLKEQEWNKHVETITKKPWKQGRYKDTAVRPQLNRLPTVIDITTPPTPTLESMTFTVRLNRPSHGLILKVTPTIIGYLRDVVTEELDSRENTPVRHRAAAENRVVTGVKYLTWSYSKKMYRALHQPAASADGTKLPKIQWLTTCKESAIQFIETGAKTQVPVVGDDIHSFDDQAHLSSGASGSCPESDGDDADDGGDDGVV